MSSAFNPRVFDNYVFRASSLDSLMVGAWDDPLTEAQQREYNDLSTRDKKLTVLQEKKLTDYQAKLDAPQQLSDTCKGVLEKIALKIKYGVDFELTGKQLDRGNNYEEASLDLINTHYKTKYIKNTKEYSSTSFKGTPDVISKYIMDIKTCYDLRVFLDKSPNHAYKYLYQLLCYDYITERHEDKGYIIFACPSWTDYDIEQTLFKSHSDLDQHYLNYNYDRIEVSKRIKLVEVPFDSVIKNGQRVSKTKDEILAKMLEQTKKWKEYLNTYYDFLP